VTDGDGVDPASLQADSLQADSLQVESLQEYFAGRLPDRMREVEDGWREARETAWREDAVRTFHRLVHSLAGAGATFGFAAVTDAARALEQRLKAVLLGAEPPDAAVVEELLEGIRRAAVQPAGS
jgi:HPt (histidine-containing phosphotransfer) domain-containing protein